MTKACLTIGLLAPPWAAVPPSSYGGTELVVSELATGLTAQGHDVILFATADSTAPVKTVRAAQSGQWQRVGQGATELPHVMRGYEALAGCDVIHDHTLLGPAWALALGLGQVVTTCHGPLVGELATIYEYYAKRLPVVAISHDQTQRAPDITIDRVIHHGINPDDYPVGDGRGGYHLFLGRMTPDKGVREAILAARAAGQRLLISAKTREPAECEYFAREIEPLLGDGVEIVGECGLADKLHLLAGAAALVNPIQWPEPFGLVMIEALACGTPVISCPRGAAPEIVDDGVTGFLRTDHDGLVDALGRVGELDRAACRDAMVRRFSTRRMVADHLDCYRSLLKA